jgi:hypothetical protein
LNDLLNKQNAEIKRTLDNLRLELDKTRLEEPKGKPTTASRKSRPRATKV